ncbi:MAG: DUF1028 domain-containing protein [Rhodospirillaceae bacterium]|jgi:uncharacterized Ntn-hydrolase superfamily protein|nr:DUF1028 domain-containing protein [Rhodospirillaceae bacterium]MBT5193772.1 DUF1028 domain-containing protein [Rhodospirillaceae bacterium]MBT5897981.1 DUF1028 domain-containing protein [Rhodospirillaceae bacterium]MBT6426878.1 DUF1028 domain-containing protein [Rhodospirillaceae bacterium]
MTWSIIARDSQTGALGIAAASRFFALGALVPWIRSGVGAVATQAMVNPMLGPAVLDRLESDQSVSSALDHCWDDDQGSALRQIHALDSHGNRAAHTGGACIDWCGHIGGPDISIAGNMLVGAQVLQASLDEYAAQAALPFPERLLASLLAGDGTGGDKRGRQSAVLRIHGTEIYPDWDIRVDDHPDAPNELARVFAVGQGAFGTFKQLMPNSTNPGGITDPDQIAAVRAKAAERDSHDG